MLLRSQFLAVILLLASTLSLGAQAPTPDPTQGFLPKEDLGVLEFRKLAPDADGRGVIVAVLDTGMDLAHPAFQRTPDGKPKVIDFYDATDSGEVAFPVDVTLNAGETSLLGLSGRRLQLGGLAVPGRLLRLGRVVGGAALPEGLASRVVGEQARDQRERALREQDRAFGGAAPAETLPPEPLVFDAITFEAEGAWRVVIDTDRDGDLGEEQALREFRLTHDTGLFPDPVRLGFAVSIRDQGRTVVLLTDGGGHGTHVGGIIGGYYGPDSPLNGLAPGVQFLAIKIGNHRIGGATSHMAMAKAIDYARSHGARVLNISFGGESFFCDGSEEGARLFDEAVERYGLFLCVSAGNNGPALNTVGAPGTSRRAFTIGALCSRLTQESNYGVIRPRRDDLFDFSSRGPLSNGSCGVDFVAPGAAVSPLPTWHLKRYENWNGTSMAAPQAAGAIALLLSAALQQQVPADVERVRLALRRTAAPLPELLPIEQGAGRMQVGPALAELKRLASATLPVPVRVACVNPTGTGEGIYDRCVLDEQPFEREVTVRPDFDERTSQEQRAAFGAIYRLVPDAEWIGAPATISVNAGGEPFRLRFDPRGMSPGLNVARVRGFAVASEGGAGKAAPPPAHPDFEILVTLVRPGCVAALNPVRQVVWPMRAGDRRSEFVRVPEGARTARIEARERLADPAPAAYSLAAKAVTLWHEADAVQTRSGAELRRGESHGYELAVVPGSVLEVVAFSQWRKGAGSEGELELTIRFVGLATDQERVEIPAGRNGAHVHLHAALGSARGRIEAAVDGRQESVAMAWEVRKDPRHAEIFDGETMFESFGRGGFDLAAGERITVGLGFDKEFLDLLDDAWYEIRNEAGATLMAEHFWTGRWDFTAPQTGRYELWLWLHDRGSLRLQQKGYVSPTITRRIQAVGVPAYASLQEGYAPAANPGGEGQPIGEVNLPAGARRSVYLRRPDLPGPGLYQGWLTITDTKGQGALLRLPLRIDTRPAAAPDLTAAKEIVRAEAVKELVRLGRKAQFSAEDKSRGEALAALLQAGGATGVEEAAATAWFRVAAAEIPAGGAAAPRALAEQALTAAIEEARKDEGRWREWLARAYAGRCEVRRRLGRLDEADQDLAAARQRVGDLLGLDEIEYRLRRDQQRPGDAVGPARKMVERNAVDAGLRRDLVAAELAAGQSERARRLVLQWLDVLPADLAGAREMAARVEAGK